MRRVSSACLLVTELSASFRALARDIRAGSRWLRFFACFSAEGTLGGRVEDVRGASGSRARAAGRRTENDINKTRCSVKKKGRTLQICVGLFELFPWLGRLLVDPVVDGRDGHGVVLSVDKIRDAAYILSGKQS